MTGMTGNSVYGLFGKTKSAKWNRYFSGFSAIRSEEISKHPKIAVLPLHKKPLYDWLHIRVLCYL